MQSKLLAYCDHKPNIAISKQSKQFEKYWFLFGKIPRYTNNLEASFEWISISLCCEKVLRVEK